MTVPSTAPALRGPAAWLARLPLWASLLVSALAGALTVFAHAPFFFVPALAIGLCVLVWQLDALFARDGRVYWAVFLRGWAFGAGAIGAGTYWVGSAFSQRPGAEGLALVGVLALALGLGVFMGAALGFARAFWTNDNKRLPVFALAVMAAELARSWLFGGFPWNLPAYVWAAGGAMSQWAAFLGAFGLSAVTVLLLSTPAAMGDLGRSFLRRAAPSVAAALVLGLMWGAGLQRLAEASRAPAAAGPVVRVADPGYTQKEKWSTNPWIVLQDYLDLSQPARGARSQIVIWPEGAIPVSPPEFPLILENEAALAAIAQGIGDRALIAGLLRRDQRELYNSAVVMDGVSGGLRIDQWYDKNRLVPFGEFIPLYDWVSWLGIGALQQIGNGFTVGAPPRRLIVPDADPAIIHICYESIFPGFTPRGADRPGWIVNVTNDAWFGRGTGPWQHANIARFRSIEEGLPTARAASGGVSGIFDGYGRTIVATGLDGGAVEAPLPPALQPTLYSQVGEWALVVVLLLIGLLRFLTPTAARGLRS